MTRTLSLKRSVLRELTADELAAVDGATGGSMSCLDYVSCNMLDCVERYTHIVRTILPE